MSTSNLCSWLSAKEVADALGVTAKTVRAWARAGLIPALRTVGAWRFDPDAVARWMTSRTSNPEGAA